MKKMKKLATVLLALSCVFAIGGIAACKDDKGNSSSTVVKIDLNTIAMTMKPGETRALSATLLSGEGTPVFTSSDEAVVTVDDKGNVTAVGIGSAVITVTVGETTATCKVTVPKVAVSGVIFRYADHKVVIGETKDLQVNVQPMLATDKTVTWTSSDESIATVDANGTVKGIAEGVVTITATTNDGEKTATCTVAVGKKLESIALPADQKEISLVATKTQKLNVTFTPSDAIIQDLKWTSSDESVAVVSGGEVFAVGEGTATITAISEDGQREATCKVTVTPYVATTGVALSKDRLNVALDGDGVQLGCAVTPANASEQEVTYKSADKTIATVDENGFVRGISEGTTTVTVTSKASETLTDTVEISVVDGKVTFYNGYYTPEGDFSFTAYDVNEVQFNGAALSAGSYTYADNTVTVAKSVLCGLTENKDNALTFVSSASGNATVDVTIAEAVYTNFNAGQLGTEVLGDLNDNAKNVRVDTTAGAVKFDVKTTEEALRINFNEDYVSALFAHPSLMNLSFSVEFTGVTVSASNLVYSQAQADGSAPQQGYTKYETKRSVNINRAAFNNAKANGTLSSLGMWIFGSNLSEGATATLHSVYPIAVDDNSPNKGNVNGRNNLYADAQLIETTGSLPYAFPALGQVASMSEVKFNGADIATEVTKDGDRAVMLASRANAAMRTAVGFDVTPAAWDRDRVYVTTKGMLDENQYVNADAVGDTYTYTLADFVEGTDKLYRVSLNGTQITTFNATTGEITVNVADLQNGHNALEVNVEHTTGTSALTTCCNTYYRSLCKITNKIANNAITFEDWETGGNYGKFGPFVFFVGSAANVVDSSVISENAATQTEYNVDYQSTTATNGRYYTDSTNEYAKVANMKAVSTSGAKDMYLSTYWVKARVAALGYDATTFTSNHKLVWRLYRPEGGSGGGTSSTYGGVANGDLWEYLYGTVSSGNNMDFLTIVNGAQYAKMMEAGAAQYLQVTFDTTTPRPKYFDDIGAGITNGRMLSTEENVDSRLSVKLI